MTQVWVVDKEGFYTWETKIVTNIEENMVTVPFKIGYVKPHFNGKEWEEGATEEEIKCFAESNSITSEITSKSLEELTKENDQLWDTVKFLLKKTGMVEE